MTRRPKRKVNAKGRNAGEKFVILRKWLIESPAYRSLGHPARSLLTELYLRHNGSNNGHVFLSYREAKVRLGNVGQSTIVRAFEQLEDRRFIVCRCRGSFRQKTVCELAKEPQGSSNRATEYWLTEFHEPSHPNYRAFMKWAP